LVAFVASVEALDILSEWEPDCRHARGLAKLGRACSAEPGLVDALRPFGPDQRVDKRFGGALTQQYLAAMAAARRPLPDDSTAAWIQRLRVYLLVRALDALHDGVVAERKLAEVCSTVRQVAERTGHPKHRWMRRLAGGSRGYFEFEAELTLHCRSIMAKPEDKAERRFNSLLLSLLEGREWSRLPAAPVAAPLAIEPYADEDTPGVSAAALLEKLGQRTRASTIDLGQIGNASVQATNPEHSQWKRTRLGDKVRLRHVEEGLFLPHAWHRLSAAERRLLPERIQGLLKSPDLADRFGAAVAFIAVLTSQTMHDAGKLKFGTEVGPDWVVDDRRGHLLREAPRFPRRWSASNAEASDWVHPLVDHWRYKLQPDVASPLAEGHAAAPRAGNLNEVWSIIGNARTLAIWFNQTLAAETGLSRLTAPCLATPVAAAVWQATQDASLARLVSGDSRSALPAASAYGAYRSTEVLPALRSVPTAGLAQLAAPVLDPDLNCCGSELDAVLARVRAAIDGLVGRLETSPANWIDRHNKLTALVVLALLSSTGARPVNSPFESTDWIDLERKLIFVSDKTAGPTQGWRVCVLSTYARDLIVGWYLPHLEAVAAAASTAPRFAAEIRRLLAGDPEAALPYLFFLRHPPRFGWVEITETLLAEECEFGWPLPWNLFRHLNATLLRRWGLHADVRDALLGHAERDAEPHGDFSMRVPRDDLEAARPLVDRLQNELGFRLPAGDSRPIHIVVPAFDDTRALADRRFGRTVRAERRSATLKTARQLALLEINDRLSGRTVDQLTPDELDRIAWAMLHRPNGIPHIMGSVRYAAFEEFLRNAWRGEERRHAKLRRRYVLAREGRPIFNELFIGAHTRLARVGAVFETLVAGAVRDERPVLAAALAVVDMVLFSRVAHYRLLAGLLRNGPGLQLVRFDGRYWLEWAFGAGWHDGKPVLRVGVSDRAAAWIATALGGKRSLELPKLPDALGPLCEAVDLRTPSLDGLVRRLVALRDQTNAFDLPGMYAAYLGGRRPASALPHSDWIRATKSAAPLGLAPETGDGPSDADEHDDADAYFAVYHPPAANSDGPALDRCRRLFDDIRDAIASGKSNRDVRNAIVSSLKTSGFGTGDAPHLLCQFAAHLLQRRPMHGARDRLRGTTVLRYWQSLAPNFLDVAADVNLIDIDEDALTELYSDVVAAMDDDVAGDDDASAASDAKQPAPQRADDDQNNEKPKAKKKREARENESDAPLRTLNRLREFHEFIRERHGIADPDWAEIAPALLVGVGRPGLVLLDEYVALLSLCADGKSIADASADQLHDAFVALACCRFGLRIGEAVGMNRADWIEDGAAILVLVRSNSTRPLKTTHSRRQVPLVEELMPVEREILARVLREWEHRHGQNRDTPLLAGVSGATFKATKNALATRLLARLKQVTRNSRCTVHHLRHAYAMRIFALLHGRALDPCIVPDEQRALNCRRLLLGTDGIDRRSVWAVGRLLGHSSPGVSLRSYLNCLHLWVEPPAQHVPRRRVQTNAIVDLDVCELDAEYLCDIAPLQQHEAGPRAPLPLRALRYLRLLAIGYSDEGAAATAELAPHQAKALVRALTLAAGRLSGDDGRYGIFKILGAIGVQRFDVLRSWIDGLDAAPAVGAQLADWLETVGTSRQVLLYEREHFFAFSGFATAFRLTPEAVWLVSRPTLSGSLRSWLRESGLEPYCHSPAQVSKTFQLDVVRVGDPPKIYPDRVAVVARSTGPLVSSYELLLLWVTWQALGEVPA
jgi:integrase